MTILRQSTEIKVRVGPFVDVGDGFTPETGVALSTADEAELLKANGAATVDISGATWAAITGADGWYDLTLTTSHTDTVGEVVVVVHDDSVCLPVFCRFQVVEESAYDFLYVSGADPDGQVAAIKSDSAAILLDTGTDGVVVAADLWSTVLPGAYTASQAGGILGDWINTGRLDTILDTIAADVVNVDGIVPAAAGDQMDLVNAPNATAVTAIQNGLATPTNITAASGVVLSAAGVDAIWDETLTSHVTADSAAVAVKDTLADTNELQSDNTPGALATIEGKIDTIDGIVDNILLDTAEIGTAGDGLTNINLPNQTIDIVGNITGNLSGSVGSVTAEVNADMTKISGSAAAADKLEESAKTILLGTVNTTATPTTTSFTSDLVEATNTHFVGRIVIFTSNALIYQATEITGYTGSNGEFTVSLLTEAPADGTTFVIV